MGSGTKKPGFADMVENRLRSFIKHSKNVRTKCPENLCTFDNRVNASQLFNSINICWGLASAHFSPCSQTNQEAHRSGVLIKMLERVELAVAGFTIGRRNQGVLKHVGLN